MAVKTLQESMPHGIEIINGDCLVEMKKLPKDSVDMILTDLPYGNTAMKWDNPIPLEPLWKEYRRVLKPNGAVALFATEPFASQLVCSNPRMFRYDLIWDKVNLYTGALLANKRPMRRHEQIMIFYRHQPTFNKQMRQGQPYSMSRNTLGVGEYSTNSYQRIKTVNNGEHNPCTILEFEGGNRSEKGYHPTQKPVALCEWLVKTYTNEGETVLDSCMGSGTTGVACLRTGRKFVGIELDYRYYVVAKKRLRQEIEDYESESE